MIGTYLSSFQFYYNLQTTSFVYIFLTIKNKIIVCLHQLYAMYLTANLHFILTLYFK